MTKTPRTHRRRRAGHRRPDQAHARAQRAGRGGDRPQRRRRAESGGRSARRISIILDLNLPVLSGIEVCRILRSRADARHVPIIMLTARTERERPRAGPRARRRRLRHQAVQPARAHRARARGAAAQRHGRGSPAAGLPGHALERRLRRGRGRGRRRADPADAPRVRAAAVSRAERNRVISRDRLLERVWGYDRLVETRSVDVHVGRLRSKLGTAGRQIETVVGLGYRFVD